MSAASFVDESRLWQMHCDMAALGGYCDGGVNRQAFSREDIQARQLMVSYAGEMGLQVYCDPIGNLFFRYQPEGAEGSPVITGSHADSQPTGGRFDGIYGVLAGFEAIRAMQQAGAAVKRPVEVVVWSNEEGSRYAPATMGSSVFVGKRKLEEFLDNRDADGLRLGDELEKCLAATPAARHREFGTPLAAYVETHIEQGPILEDKGAAIGAVTDIQGARWFEIEVVGETRHAGSTPLSIRRDAFQGAFRAVAALNAHFADTSDIIRFTVGRFDVEPNSPNTVVERVAFSIDFRHPDSAVLATKGDAIAEVVAAVVGPCDVNVRETFNSPPVHFNELLVSTVRDAAKKCDFSCTDIASGAMHDAMLLTGHCPTSMIFVPSHKGISHHPDEYSGPEQLAQGAAILAETLVSLANSI